MKSNETIKNPKNKKGLISKLIFLICLTVLVVTLFLSLGELEEIVNTILSIGQSNNWVWLIVAFLLALIYFCLWPLSLCFFAKSAKAESTFTDSFLIGCSEHFYNGITPFSAGGQPFQVYSYSKRNVPASKGTGIVLANFVVFMMVTNLIALIALIFFPYFTNNLSQIPNGYSGMMDANWFIPIAIVGYVINFLVLVFMFALGLSKKIRNGIVGIVKAICKIKFIGKHLSKAIPALEEYCDNAQTAFKELAKHKKAFVFAFISRLFAMIAYYAIPFFILLAVGINVTPFDFIIIFFGTSFAITAVVFIPTPGGTGGIELAFSIVLASISTASLGSTQAVSLLWRLITFYFILIISFIAGLIFEARVARKEKKELKEENKNE